VARGRPGPFVAASVGHDAAAGGEWSGLLFDNPRIKRPPQLIWTFGFAYEERARDYGGSPVSVGYRDRPTRVCLRQVRHPDHPPDTEASKSTVDSQRVCPACSRANNALTGIAMWAAQTAWSTRRPMGCPAHHGVQMHSFVRSLSPLTGRNADATNVPLDWTDAHHLTMWIHDGQTKVDEMTLLCRFHHVQVHEGHWTITMNPHTGDVSVRRPNGQPYELPPTHPGSAEPASPTEAAAETVALRRRR
jgi:hypothetical protein